MSSKFFAEPDSFSATYHVSENCFIRQFEIGNFKNFVYLIVHRMDQTADPSSETLPQSDQSLHTEHTEPAVVKSADDRQNDSAVQRPHDHLALVIDPQARLTAWESSQANLNLAACLLTHSHWDHVAGVPEIARKYGCPIFAHASELHRLHSSTLAVKKCLIPIDLEKPLEFGPLKLTALHTPGHSVGEICYFLEGPLGKYLFSGDTVFVGDVGRCDLDTGDVGQMFQSLQFLKQLPSETILLPGHNYGSTPYSTMKEQILNSAAFRCQTVEELDALP